MQGIKKEWSKIVESLRFSFPLNENSTQTRKEFICKGHGRHGKSRSSRRERRDDFSFYFRDLYGEHLLLSERSLGGCIGFGGSSQAGELSRHCCIGTGRLL